ncbi:MAG: LacI family DNA-binding transcriptional regulator, partial [Salana multivorans]|nr:LacI family DNA-binding transcriptional regulator [Salana multivorans]
MGKAARVTSADVAHRAGVSTSAVSYAFNGRPGISDETRARIHAAAKELGWRPNSAARALTGARAGLVGLVIKRPARSLGTEAFYA